MQTQVCVTQRQCERDDLAGDGAAQKSVVVVRVCMCVYVLVAPYKHYEIMKA